MNRELRIAVIDKNPLRAAILEEGLREAGHMSVVQIDDTADLLDRIRRSIPTSSSSISKARAATSSSRCSR